MRAMMVEIGLEIDQLAFEIGGCREQGTIQAEGMAQIRVADRSRGETTFLVRQCHRPGTHACAAKFFRIGVRLNAILADISKEGLCHQ
jgi:hypothetical protein